MAVIKIYNGKNVVDVEVGDDFVAAYAEMEYRESLVERKETRRHQSLGGFIAPDNSSFLEDNAEQIIVSEKLKTALSRLTDKQRAVFISHALYGESMRGIGRRLGINKDTVSEHYHTAVLKLKKLLKNTPPF